MAAAPRNHEHFHKLMAFLGEVLAVCNEIEIRPLLTSSLAVLAYTQDPAMEVHDVDLSCAEADFPRLRRTLEEHGISCRITDWHVLQARRADLKIDFDSTEYWMHDISEPYDCLKIGDSHLSMVSLEDLQELYRRGLAGTAGKSDANNRTKHEAFKAKLCILDAIASSKNVR